MRFLLKYKNKDGKQVANARIILQGFKHSDVTTKKLDTESPTLSKVGRSLVVFLCAQMGWKVWTADVKSAFLQADRIDDEVRIFAIPNADIRKRLARMIGLKEDEILRILQPAFGDVRAPRQWYGTADRVMTGELTYLRHQLDRCVYLSTREATENDDSFRVFNKKGASMVVDGIIGIHVDDIMGGGESVFKKEDVNGDMTSEPACFRDRVHGLFKRFKFGSIDFAYEQVFCGVHLEQSLKLDVINMSLKHYIHHVKPVTVDKVRKQLHDEPLLEKETSQMRSLLGALAWPATQCMPMLSASVSLLQASMANPKISDLLECNKVLRFAKEAVERFRLKMHRHGELSEVVFGAYTDAAWAVRADGSPQGGYVIFAASRGEVEADKPFKLTTLDWSSKRLTRVCRSSLAAETQAAANAVDELEWLRSFWALILWPLEDPLSEDLNRASGTFVITDAKSLYDAANSMSAGLKLSERRSAIELAMANERLRSMGGGWKWCNSAQQLADGLTKGSARAASLDAFSRGVISLRFD